MLIPTAPQAEGIQWLASRRQGLLADVPGFGKSLQALLAARQRGAQRILIACPAVARLNWEREVAKAGLDLPVLRITDKSTHGHPSPDAPQIVIASYDGIAGSKKLRGALNAGIWDVLIMDEAHRAKSKESRRTKAFYGASIDGRRCLVGKAMATWLLSGSPMPNHAGELWTHLRALWPHLIRHPVHGHIMDQEEFLGRYCVLRYSQFDYKVVGYKDKAGLAALLDQIMLRRTVIDGMPELIIRDDPVLVEVEDAELKALEAHEEFDDLKAVLDSAEANANDLAGVEDDFLHLATLTRLTGVLKAKPAAELIIDEITKEDKVLVFAQHREVIETMAQAFRAAGLAPAMIHGGVNDTQRNEEIDRFQQDDSCKIFIGQLQACQEAITLTAGNRIWVVESPWSPEYLEQVFRRAWRRGQQKTCFARFIAIAGSIDEQKAKTCALKAQNLRAIIQPSRSITDDNAS